MANDIIGRQKESFRLLTRTDASIHLTMITADGVEHNAGWNSIQSEVTLNDLFTQE